MLANLRRLFRHRELIRTLVARELKARYRGSILGFFWSFANPLLLLLVYTFVFSVILPGFRAASWSRTRCSSSAGCSRGPGLRPR